MRAYQSFAVRPRLPEPLAPLQDLAMNLYWSWEQRTRDLFHWLDPEAWERSGHDPVRLLTLVGRQRLATLASDPAFVSFLRDVHEDLQHYLERGRWFQSRPSPLRSVAYFSPEFGLAQALPQYSGGLGVLAGDHLKAASGLGVPIVGVGLLYRQGYFRQQLNADGWQEERYVPADPHAMAVTPRPVRVRVEVGGSPLVAQVWCAQVGRVPLYLLDTDLDENDESGRMVTDRLYGGDSEHRLHQEILLGIGGVRALEALGEAPQVFHTNEGHAGFLSLERIRRHIVGDGLSFPEAVEAVRSSTVFTTHTPVPAGIDRFARPLMERCFKAWADDCGVDFEVLMGLGHEPGQPPEAPFNMAVMGLRLAGRANGVSRLHGRVSRRMFANLWPGVPEDDVPIGSITNGVHFRTWVSPDMEAVFDRWVLPEWQEAGPDRWARIEEAGDDELWYARQQGRERLVAFARRRLKESALAKGVSEPDLAWCDEALDPRVLTMGFARRFAPYKRATLLLSDPGRLADLLLSADRPVQLVFAGKAHPADDAGKQLVREIVQFARQPHLRHRVVFLEDYDIATARTLYQGCDVWLNHPRRPLEACGTSGEKAALNGALNCSIRDGWWDECYDGRNGWAIPSAEHHHDLAWRDRVEALALFDILEREVVPLFYERPGGLPSRWLQRVRASLRSLGPFVSATRMVRDYVEQLYEPQAARAEAMGGDGFARTRAFAAWKQRIWSGWSAVRVEWVSSEDSVAELDQLKPVSAVVALGPLTPDDVDVQVLHGPVGADEELSEVTTLSLAPSGPGDQPGRWRYDGSFPCERAGRHGFTVRVVPRHPDLVSFAELGCVAWA